MNNNNTKERIFFTLTFKSYFFPLNITPWRLLAVPLPGPLKTLTSSVAFGLTALKSTNTLPYLDFTLKK